MAFLLLASTLLLQAADNNVENPFKNANVGDWVEYESAVALPNGQKMTVSMKQTVAAKTAKEVTLKVSVSLPGANPTTSTVKLPLDQPFDPTKTTMPGGSGGKSEKVGEGKEAITVRGKRFECTWVEMKTAVPVQGRTVESVAKIWLSPEVPLGGLVKMQAKMQGQEVTLEAKNWGKGGR